MTAPYEDARQLAAWGFTVYPAKHQGKMPVVPWKQYLTSGTTERLEGWFSRGEPLNMWIACGRPSRCVVLDIDSDEAHTYWQAKMGELLDATTCVRTAKGWHYYFTIDDDQAVPSWSHHDAATGLQWDVRADGTGVIVPPSVHESGHVYEWVRDPDHMQPMPDLLRGPGGHGDLPDVDIAPVRSMLSQLLSNPPDEGGRNVWMSRVAGHYAKQYRGQRDAYEVQCRLANTLCSPPLDDDELAKTLESIWAKENAKPDQEVAQQSLDQDCGWLLSAKDHLLTLVTVKDADGNSTQDLRQWGNFDLRALGVVEDGDALRTYDVEIHRKRTGDVRNDLLPAQVLADSRRMRAWLAQHGVNLTTPAEREVGAKMAWTDRLQAYIESQNPPRFQVVNSLGWHGDGFIVHEGVIRDDGMHGFDGVKPNPLLRKLGDWRYGVVEVDEARRVLNEVLTFHHPIVASVFGAWWAACLLKPQIQQRSSQFPIMGLEAPSESGKTTGMFSKLIQLAGNGQGQTMYTPAALRDALGSHRSGIVWIDDEDSLDHLTRLFRSATGEGSMTKKGEDNTGSVTAHLVAPLLISGEALGLDDQKALRDRTISLEVPSPTDRMSLHDPSRPQWDDIVELGRTYPDLTVMAGTIVQLALQQAALVEQLPSLKGDGHRFGDKMATLRLGARILAGMTGDDAHVQRVDEWVACQEDTGAENALTLEIIPTALAMLGMPDHVAAPMHGEPGTPVFYRADGDLAGVWVNTMHLAEWWRLHKRGKVEQRVASRAALNAQLKALGGTERSIRARVNGYDNYRPMYRRLPDEVGVGCVARALQGVPGVHHATLDAPAVAAHDIDGLF